MSGRSKWKIVLTAAGVLSLLAVLGAGLWLYSFFKRNVAPYSADIVEHFKYGSVGTEARLGVPAELFDVLPSEFADLLPPGPGEGWARFGFLYEKGHARPVGTSVREMPVALVGLNCAACHTATVRDAEGAEPRMMLGGPAIHFDIEAYFRFLLKAAHDPRFTPDRMMAAIERNHPHLSFIDRLLYRLLVIKETKKKLEALIPSYTWLDVRPDFGPGRVDTFNPYKVRFGFNMDRDTSVGTADFPSIFNQRMRAGMHLHWDGNNDSIVERDKSAAIGAGAEPASLDIPAMARIETWLMDLPPPPFPKDHIDQARAERGKKSWDRACANCHAPGSPRVGTVIPISEVGTDPERLDSFTAALSEKMNMLGQGYPWRFSHFQKTNGYAAAPLDGVWTRSPFLHNGSVINLRQLLFPEERVATFYRAHDVFDWISVGYVAMGKEAERDGWRYDTGARGNSNVGHLFGTDLPARDREDLIEFLKTL